MMQGLFQGAKHDHRWCAFVQKASAMTVAPLITRSVMATMVAITLRVMSGTVLTRQSPESQDVSTSALREFSETANAKTGTLQSSLLVRHG